VDAAESQSSMKLLNESITSKNLAIHDNSEYNKEYL
jgi:hypothetical protein